MHLLVMHPPLLKELLEALHIDMWTTCDRVCADWAVGRQCETFRLTSLTAIPDTVVAVWCLPASPIGASVAQTVVVNVARPAGAAQRTGTPAVHVCRCRGRALHAHSSNC